MQSQTNWLENTMIPGTLYLSQLEKPLNNVTISKSLAIIVQIVFDSIDTIDLNVSVESILALSLSETHLCYCIFDSKVSESHNSIIY